MTVLLYIAIILVGIAYYIMISNDDCEINDELLHAEFYDLFD